MKIPKLSSKEALNVLMAGELLLILGTTAIGAYYPLVYIFSFYLNAGAMIIALLKSIGSSSEQ